MIGFGLTLLLAGCSRQEQTHREEATKDTAAKGPEPVRWAFANKREIDSAISQWSRTKMEDFKKSEALPPEKEEQVRRYEALQSELMRKQMEAMRRRFPPPPGAPGPAPDRDYETLSNQVAEARAPIADIVDRRSRQASQYREQFTADKLVGEYAKDRFDLVVDSSDQVFSRSAVLYRTSGEVLDITDGVIKLFKEKAKP
jgi:hypothetical protein